MITATPGELITDKGEGKMGAASYTAHISNKKSAITSKAKLKAVANHNLRKYRSSDYSRENIFLLYGTKNLYKDVQEVYHREFDEIVRAYNEKQKRADRRINDYFEHVSELAQDMAVEIIMQCGDKEFWEKHADKTDKMRYVYGYSLRMLEQMLPEFKIANAVIHFDEASPHMHVVGVPVHEGYKKGLSKRVSKRNVFTQESMSVILQGKLREAAEECFRFHFKENFAEKKSGRNQDLTVIEYKVEKESERLWSVTEDIQRNEQKLKRLKESISCNMEQLENTEEELARKQQDAKQAEKILGQVRHFMGMFKLFAPSIQEYANAVETVGRIDAGNCFRGILNELGRLLEHFRELIKEGMCWFPKLMRWKTSVGEVAPVFEDNDEGYSYKLCGYRNVLTMESYSKEKLQPEIRADRRVGTVDVMEANIEAMERDLAEILRLNGEQKRLWMEYEEWKRK